MKSSANACSRARPLLGTYVEISVSGGAEHQVRAALARGFSEVVRLESILSFHDASSELSHFNRLPVRKWMQTSSALRQVLKLALELQEKSAGRFNVAIAEPLIAWKILPGKSSSSFRAWPTLASVGIEISGRRVRKLQPVRVDLGGIAKGYVVDQAVDVIQKFAPRSSGMVNAGGDLRVWGNRSQIGWIRSGSSRNPKQHSIVLYQQALATSSVSARQRVSAYVDIVKKSPLIRAQTVVVRADRCVIADALTKIGLLVPRKKALSIAAEYGAELGYLK